VYFFVLAIRRKNTEPGAQSEAKLTPLVTPLVTPPVASPVTPPVGEFVIRFLVLLAHHGPLSNSEIFDAFQLKDCRRRHDTHIDQILADGLVERTIPDKPTSCLQKYRLTETGRRLLEQAGEEG